MKAFLGRTALRLGGWKIGNGPPDIKKFVLIAAPHTSNWDLIWLLAFAWHFGIDVSWLGKHTLFKPPLGWILKPLGGVAVDRRAPGGVVGEMARIFAEADELIIVVPPEGTRGYRDHWKSGFFRIAEAANVPIVCGYLDYGVPIGGMDHVIDPSVGLDAVMDQVRAFYIGKKGKFPDKFGRPYVEGESKPPIDWPPAD